MKHRQFGKIDFKVSALGFGVMRLPSKRNPLDPRVDEKQAITLIRHAIDNGVNYFDTAWSYHFGASEKILGKALQDGYREKVFLVTKLPMLFVNKKEDFNRFFDEQLKRLQTDYVDCYLFHGLTEKGFHKIKDHNLIGDMEREQKAGRIKHIGFSFHDTLPVFKKIVDFYNWDLVQIQYNYLDTSVQAGFEGLKYAHKKGMAITIMEPLKGGMLAHPPQDITKQLKQANSHRTAVDWALQYLWNLEEVSVVLSGMSSIEQLDQNIASACKSDVNALTQKEKDTINSIIAAFKDRIMVPCTSCKYCMPCPMGVNIPEVFAIANSANSKPFNLFDRFVKFMTKRKYKKMVTKKSVVHKRIANGNASLCTACGKCVPLCPQEINIPAELKKVHNYLI